MQNKTLIFLILNLIFLSPIVIGQEKVSVKIFPEIKHQKIQSIGGNYSMTRYTNSASDAIGDETLKQFKPGIVRVALPLRIRKAEYSEYKGNLLVNQPLVISLFESLKRMKQEFGVRKIILSVWDVPNELVVDPSKVNQRIIKPESYDEVLDMLVACLVKAKNDYGVEVDYFSFNESDGGWQVIFSPGATIAFIKKAQARFAAAGLKTKFLLADTAQTLGTVEFGSMIMADSTIWDCLGPLAFHCWWSENIPDSEFERIAAYGKALNKPVWCTELGFDAAAHTVKGMFQSWDYAFRLAKITHRMFKYAEVEASMYWTWQNDYPIMSTDLKTMYPSYYITRHLVDYLNEGTQIVHSISSDPEILPFSGIHENGVQVLQIINVKNIPVSIDIEGYNSESIDMVTTTETNFWNEQKNVAKSKNNHTIISLLPRSVNTLIINKSLSATLDNHPIMIPFSELKFTDIGKSTKQGDINIVKGKAVMKAGGADIWGKNDEFMFGYKKLTGDFDISVQVLSLDKTNLYTKAGIMARAGLSDNCQHVYFQVFPDNSARNNNQGGCEFQYRAEKAAEMKAIYPDKETAGEQFDVDFPNTWIRLKRVGDVFESYVSRDNLAWTKYSRYTQKMPTELLVGLAVTSHDSAEFTEAGFASFQNN